ncbi:MAG: HAD-IA family hydrolase [Cenarchaeum sp. SB0664_bin_35]|nr:HAD-IA family hydrolase [Cenarchaeum sp. SB0664_bin_35]
MISADGIVFDCDGVLVDVADSYYMTISLTVQKILDTLNITAPTQGLGPLIQSFKDTGAYNNEIDLAYSVILSAAAGYRARLDPYDTTMKLSINNRGIQHTEQRANDIHDIHDIIEELSYPGSESMVQEVFDQIFYGPVLYRNITGQHSRFNEPGLIDTEQLLIDEQTSHTLVELFHHKIGMVTGRGYKSASYTLGRFMNIFDIRASSFLEDEPRYLAKPNPIPLKSAMQKMNLKNCIYVGDSVEDLIMAKCIDSVIFVGVWGSSPQPAKRHQALQDRGADYLFESICEMLQSC